MAIWQVHFSLKRVFSNKHTDSQLWKDSIQELVKEFGEQKSWSTDINQYGDIESTCIEIEMIDAEETNIDVRLDLRTLSKHQIQIICDFANINELFLQKNGELLEANMENVLLIIQNSTAYRFLQNPNEFLK